MPPAPSSTIAMYPFVPSTVPTYVVRFSAADTTFCTFASACNAATASAVVVDVVAAPLLASAPPQAASPDTAKSARATASRRVLCFRPRMPPGAHVVVMEGTMRERGPLPHRGKPAFRPLARCADGRVGA